MRHDRRAVGGVMRGAIISVAIAGMLGLALQGARAQAKAKKAKGPDLPYTTIDHPQFVPAAQAGFLGPKDIVLGVSDGKTAKAYPAAILSQHGVVQDAVADGPIAITW